LDDNLALPLPTQFSKMTVTTTDRIWSRGFILLCIGNLFMAMAFYQLMPVLPVYIKEELGGDKGQIGGILALFTISALLIRPFTGIALDRLGRKWIFLLSLLVFSLMFSGYILAGSLLAIALVRLIHGVAWGITTTASSTVVVDILPRAKLGEGIGFYGLSMTLAMALGPLLGIWMTRGAHYEWIFLETSVMSLLFFLMAIAVKYPPYHPPAIKPRYRLSELFEKTSLPASLSMMILMIPYGGIVSFIAIYGSEKGFVESAATFFIMCAVGVALTRYFAGRIFDRSGPKKLMIASVLFETLCFPILVLVPGETGFGLAAFLLGLGVGTVLPTIQALVNTMVPAHRRGAANSTLFTAIDLGIGAGMLGIGWLGQWLGLDLAFLLCTLICVAGGLYYLLVVDKHYHKNLELK